MTVRPPALRTGPSQPMNFRQGTIVAWNPLTLENTIEVDKQTFDDLPVLGLAETATYQPGDVVGLMCLDSTWAIIGQLVIPGTAQAESALSFLSSTIYAAEVSTFETLAANTAYTDLTTPGPAVTALIGPSGRALVTVSCAMLLANGSSGGDDSVIGAMGYAVSGATTIAASSSSPYRITTTQLLTASRIIQASRQSIRGALNPGFNTFTAKYDTSASENQVSFSTRSIVVQAL